MSHPTMKERIVALGPIRHACHACGVCCTGWRVTVVPAERERLLSQAAELGVPDPIDESDSSLRRENGACVFLGEDKLCRIHARFGGDEKPVVCQIFPRMAVRGDDFVRIGADPGCTSTWRTFSDGPELDFPVVASPRYKPLPPELAETEETIIRLCRVPEMTIPTLVGLISGQTGHEPRFPPGFVGRLLKAMKGLHEWLTHPEAGPLVVADIKKATNYIKYINTDRPPKVSFTREMNALSLEMLQRTVFLRIGDAVLPPMGKLVLVIAGAIACAYAYPKLEQFGRGMAAWSRLSRVQGFWEPFIPDVDVARYIMTGAR